MRGSKVMAVLRQEFRMTAANKAFIVITIIGPFLIFAISVLPTLLAGSGTGSSPASVAIVTEDVGLFTEVAENLRGTPVEPSRFPRLQPAMDAAQRGDFRGVLRIPSDTGSGDVRYFTDSGQDFATIQILSDAVGRVLVTRRLADAGLDPARIQTLTRQPQVITEPLTEEGTGGQDFFSVFAVAMTFVMLLYMTVLLYGQMIGRSVIIEKTSKTVEIMLSSVHPRELMFGKILGKGLAGLLQYGLWIGLGLLMAYLVGPAVGFTPPSGLNAENMAFLVIFFVLAFFLYSSAYALLGSGAEDEQHLGQLAWPLIMLLVIPLVMISSFIFNPDSSLAVGLSIFPFTAPIVMLLRIVIGSPGLVQILVSIALILATTVAVVLVASRVFAVGILMTGRRFKIKEILSWVGIRQ